jgi:hypothetical protein
MAVEVEPGGGGPSAPSRRGELEAAADQGVDRSAQDQGRKNIRQFRAEGQNQGHNQPQSELRRL